MCWLTGLHDLPVPGAARVHGRQGLAPPAVGVHRPGASVARLGRGALGRRARPGAREAGRAPAAPAPGAARRLRARPRGVHLRRRRHPAHRPRQRPRPAGGRAARFPSAEGRLGVGESGDPGGAAVDGADI